MKKLMILLSALFLLMSLVAITGCDGEDATKDGEAVVATHDCDGGCGMKDMPADKTTEVDGKFYCAGCVPKDDGGHEGHNH